MKVERTVMEVAVNFVNCGTADSGFELNQEKYLG